MERFYYKKKDNKGFLNLKSPLVDKNYIQITKEEFEELTKPKVYIPTAEEKAVQEKAKKIVSVAVYNHFKRDLEEQEKHKKKVLDFSLKNRIEISEAEEQKRKQEEAKSTNN